MFGSGEMPGALGWVGNGSWEAIHADWPAYPGDRSWEHALLRLGDFPIGTDFCCIDIIDQCALLVAEVGIRDRDLFSDQHMHVALRLEELIDLDTRGLVEGVQFDTELSDEQLDMKRVLGPEKWERFRSGEMVLGYKLNDEFIPLPVPPDSEVWEDDWENPLLQRHPQRVAIFAGTRVKLLATSDPEIERIARDTLEIPPSVQTRVTTLLEHEFFDTVIRDLGAVLETRMRLVTHSEKFGIRLVEQYCQILLDSKQFLPARIKSLRNELRSIFRFVRNEFAHRSVEVPASRAYTLVSRLCWHVSDVELVAEQLAPEVPLPPN